VGSKEFLRIFEILFRRFFVFGRVYRIEVYSLELRIVCSRSKEDSEEMVSRICFSSDSRANLLIL